MANVDVEQRRRLAHAQQCSATVKAFSFDTPFEKVSPALFELAQATEKVMCAQALTDGQQTIWSQRAQWLMEE